MIFKISSETRGGQNKKILFEWWFDVTKKLIITESEKRIIHKFHIDEIIEILTNIEKEFGGEYFPLANNVKKLGNGTEVRGLGTVILDHMPGNITHAQGSSYLGPILETLKFLEWNKKHKGIKWRLIDTNFDYKAVLNKVKSCLSKSILDNDVVYKKNLEEVADHVIEEINLINISFYDEELSKIKVKANELIESKLYREIISEIEKIQSYPDIILRKEIEIIYNEDELKNLNIAEIIQNIRNKSLKELYEEGEHVAVKIILAILSEKYRLEKDLNKRNALIYFIVKMQMENSIKYIENLQFRAFFENEKSQLLWKEIKRIGFYEGFIEGIKRVENPDIQKLLHSLVASSHGKFRKKIKKEKLFKELRELVQDDVKSLYNRGENREHWKIAADLREMVLNLLNKMNSGRLLTDKENKDPYVITLINIQKSSEIQWTDMIKYLSKKKDTSRDFFLKAVKKVAPEKFITGKQ